MDALGRVRVQGAFVTSYISHTTIDCANAYELSEWWKALLGYRDVDGDPNEPGHEECMIRDPETGHQLLFIEVPDEELPAKRIHFDLRPRAGTRDEELARLLEHGATQVADRRSSSGGWSGACGIFPRAPDEPPSLLPDKRSKWQGRRHDVPAVSARPARARVGETLAVTGSRRLP